MTKEENNQYNEFLERKRTQRIESGFEVKDEDLNPALFPFQKYCVKRALSAGKFALFEDCGPSSSSNGLRRYSSIHLSRS